MKVLLGVTGGIAAYKSAEIIRLLTEAGHQVRVLPTENALRFIGATTLEALSHNPIDANLYTDVADVKHIEVAQWADVILVAPATASFVARTAAGLADDLLGNILLATNAKVFVAPAMHTEMWVNPATVANIAKLRERGLRIIEPGVGRLTGKDSGVGRLAEPSDIVSALVDSEILLGRRVVVTAGGTREPIDAVRFIGNYSSGKQGLAIAKAAAQAGAQVVLIAANMDVTNGFAQVVNVQTASELESAVNHHVRDADVLVMAAAVADFRFENPSNQKIKRSELGGKLTLELVANPDILAGVHREGLFKVGFAAEASQDLADLAMSKLRSKGCDLVVANDISGGAIFGQEESAVQLFDANGTIDSISGSKGEIARALISQISERLN